MSVFETLNKIDVSGKTEKKNGLTYLSWAYAWGEVKKLYPTATYKVYEREDGCIYWTDGHTGWVKTGVTIEEIEYIEYLPIMDYNNRSITVDKITSFDVNKAIQRSLTKAIARHGLGLYIYAGEDLPEDAKPESKPEPKQEPEPKVEPKEVTDEQMKELASFNVSTEKVATWLRKEPIDLNYEDVEKALKVLRKKEK